MKPFIKWAGGKSQLLKQLQERMPEHYNRYCEPFVGAGALFLSVDPSWTIINDSNSILMNAYHHIHDDPEAIIKLLERFLNEFNEASPEQRKANYYRYREEFNEGIKSQRVDFYQTALFIFLNKCGFNGLFRLNSQGLYNVPYGARKKLGLYDAENIREVSRHLRCVLIETGDFEAVCGGLTEGDFVFFDSPYYDTFDNYQSGGFSVSDHRRLAELFRRLDEKGVYCMLTNSNTDFIKDLYRGFIIEEVPVKRMINRDGQNRKGTELIIRNYETEKEKNARLYRVA